MGRIHCLGSLFVVVSKIIAPPPSSDKRYEHACDRRFIKLQENVLNILEVSGSRYSIPITFVNNENIEKSIGLFV